MSDLLLRSSRQKRKPLPAFPGGRQASIMRALWLAGSHSLPLIERPSRGYAFLLAGDTLRMLGFAAVSRPGTLFDPAVIRVEKIMIGILSADLTDGFGLPVRPHIDTLPKQEGNGAGLPATIWFIPGPPARISLSDSLRCRTLCRERRNSSRRYTSGSPG